MRVWNGDRDIENDNKEDWIDVKLGKVPGRRSVSGLCFCDKCYNLRYGTRSIYN